MRNHSCEEKWISDPVYFLSLLSCIGGNFEGVQRTKFTSSPLFPIHNAFHIDHHVRKHLGGNSIPASVERKEEKATFYPRDSCNFYSLNHSSVYDILATGRRVLHQGIVCHSEHSNPSVNTLTGPFRMALVSNNVNNMFQKFPNHFSKHETPFKSFLVSFHGILPMHRKQILSIIV